ncbi:hypothetical protein cypCar_00027081, partial [Cyprinus carpio]
MNQGFSFGKPVAVNVTPSPVSGAQVSIFPATSSDSNSPSTPENITTPLPTLGVPSVKFQVSSLLENEWRNMEWSEEVRETLMESVRSFKPASETVTEARVLLVGPVGAGKSSFISSVQSVFSGRVINRAMVGSSSSTSFTKK